MAITEAQLMAIDEILASAQVDGKTATSLRQVAPGVTAVRCDPSDVRDVIPFRSYANCDLFLLDGRDHCVRITEDPGVATGVIVAPRGRDVT
jgi:hypothetical protein